VTLLCFVVKKVISYKKTQPPTPTASVYQPTTTH